MSQKLPCLNSLAICAFSLSAGAGCDGEAAAGFVALSGFAGAAAGAVIGKKVGGDNGAVVGAAVGAATGVAIGSKDKPAQAAPTTTASVKVSSERSYSDERDRHEHHDNGRHLGQHKDKHKSKHKNKHKHDD